MSDDEPEINYSLEDGKYLVRLARKSILHYLTFNEILPEPKDAPTKFFEESGVFVTLNRLTKNGEKQLRGCIGFPLPIYPLIKGTIEAAKSAAVNDHRFPTVTIDQMKDIVVEVTILTPPQEIKVTDPKEYLEKIKIGRDGLIIRKGSWSGLLLPQVPIEWKWNAEQFLDHTCNKAGLPGDCWKDPKTKVLRFSGIIFQEVNPNGEIEPKKI
jgi:hypothetical protein